MKKRANAVHIKFLLIPAILLIFMSPAGASLDITHFFSDFTSSDVVIKSTGDNNGKAVFQLLDGTAVIETQEVQFEAKDGQDVSKVIIWKNKPKKDYYTASVSIYNETVLHANRTYPISYGTAAMPSYHVVDLSPTNEGVQLLLRSFNPTVVDITIELLDNHNIVYTKTKEDMTLNSDTELKIDWPFLLNNNEKYTVRAKILMHRLYAEPLINTYVASFTANDDVEILPEDVEVDEYGASVTIRGKSQVAFDGFINISATNRDTGEKKTFRQQVGEILINGKEDTAGVVWKDLEAGTYDISILAVNNANAQLDKYETVLRIPKADIEPEASGTDSTPALGYTGFASFVIIALVIFAFAGRKRGT